MKFLEKDGNGMELQIDMLEREILFRALELYAAEGEPEDFVVNNMFAIYEMEDALDLPRFADKGLQTN